jgi:hypothetical protein
VPVGRTSTRRELTAVGLALGGVVAAVLVGVLLLRLARGGDVEVRLGSDTFDAGRAGRIAAEVAERGPALYSDVAGGSRDLIVNHLGGDPATGWVAFSAREPGAARDCYVEWRPDEGRFVDRCSGRSYPPDGTGLEQFPAAVVDGNVIVDINRAAERRAEQERSTTSSIVESGIPRATSTTRSG